MIMNEIRRNHPHFTLRNKVERLQWEMTNTGVPQSVFNLEDRVMFGIELENPFADRDLVAAMHTVELSRLIDREDEGYSEESNTPCTNNVGLRPGTNDTSPMTDYTSTMIDEIKNLPDVVTFQKLSKVSHVCSRY